MKKIGIIGCGNMGETILKGIVSNKIALAKDVSISDIDSTKLDRIKSLYKIDATFNNSVIAKESDIIIVAVKPQEIAATLSSISGCLDRKKLLISIAAGATIKKIRSFIGGETPIIRVMPNMPALIGKGFSALAYSKNIDKNLVKIAKKIFNSIGDVIEVKENDLDAITAVSGSGPAYFFYLVELLIKSGVKLGLRSDVAKKAAFKTALGSIELLNQCGEEPSALRKRVMSKGGTTEAAFKVFKKRKLEDIIQTGIKAAKERSRELSGR